MKKDKDRFDVCYKCGEIFDIYEMYVHNGKHICVPCYNKLGIYYAVDVENKAKAKQIYRHVPRDIIDYTYARRDPDKWIDWYW